MKITLEELCAKHEAAFIRLASDFHRNDKAHFVQLFEHPGGPPIENPDHDWFQFFLRRCEHERLDWRPRPGMVSHTHYLLIFSGDNGEETAVGYGVMRFPLNDRVESTGGNLVFAVPPAFRRQGWGTLTLNRMLFEAVRAGMARALVTCAFDNGAARKCIEKNRGEWIEQKENLEYFWIRFR